MKKQLLLGNSSFFNFYRVFKFKHTILCASILTLTSGANAASEKIVKETESIKSTIALNVRDVVVKGTVKNDSGEPLAGATVSIKGTNIRVATNADGEYQITSPDGGTMVFTYVGYLSQEITVGNKTLVNITMLIDSQKFQMNQVVIVGYGTQKRSDITGSVTSVPKERLSQLPVTNVLHALEGAVAGLKVNQTSSVPGSSASVLVRGVNSINANTAPLTVIDGVPFSNLGGSMNDINPNDIESIEVLKDASAVAVYGTRGSSGVILITTKRGKTGEPTIRYSAYAGPEYQNKTLTPLNAEEYVKKYVDFLAQRGQQPTATPVPNQYEIENYTAGKTVDWMKEISQQGSIQDHNISISGGSDRLKYFVSGAYQKQQGVLKGYQYSRASFRSNLDAKVTDWLTAGTSLFFANNNTDGGTVRYTAAMQMSPYGRAYEANGTYTIFPMFSETNFRNPL
ncbi:MAG: SusC/RagA family TonB-linked outer membrane protein, partial [Bacteroidia bacterium]